MGPRQLQSQIHSDYSSESSVWESYRTGISDLYSSAYRKDDYNSHLIREYNKKIDRLNQLTGLFITPFDAGYSFIGTTILPPIGVNYISGFAFPQQTLYAPTGSSYTWKINDIVTGSGSSFVPAVYDIGKTVSCLVDETTYSTVVWHPNQISAVKAFWWAYSGAYNQSNALCSDEEVVDQWRDSIGNAIAQPGEGTLANMASYEASDIYTPSLQHDITDYEKVNATSENIFDAVRNAYCFIGAKDVDPTTGNAEHCLFSCNNTATLNDIKLSFGTRKSAASKFYINAKKTDGTLVTLTGSNSNSNYNVLTAEVLFADSAANLRVNGQYDVTGFLNGSSQVAGNSTSMYINKAASSLTTGPSYITTVILAAGNQKISDTDRNRIERFIGLLGNVDVPLI